ncbi:hypothetical protein ABPG74_021472 [Tetrahymena malaccensis]
MASIIAQSPKALNQNYMAQQQVSNVQSSSNSMQRIPSAAREPTTPMQQMQKEMSNQSNNQQQSSNNQNGSAHQQQRIIKNNVSYGKGSKNSDNNKLLNKQKEEKIYNEKEKQLFEQFHEYKNIKTYFEAQNFQVEDTNLKREMDRLMELNTKKFNELKILKEKEKQLNEQNELDVSNSTLQKSFFTMSRMNYSSSYPDQEQLVYINSIYKMKKSLNNSMLSLKQSMNPQLIFEAVEQLVQNQQKVKDMTEVQVDIMGQLEQKVEEIKVCIVIIFFNVNIISIYINILNFLLNKIYIFKKDKIQKERNQIIDMNQLFDKKFRNLELREINAQKKNEEAEVITQTYNKDLQDTYYRSQIALQEKQQEKSDIYNEIKHMKHEITVCLVEIDKKKLIKEQQHKEIQKLEQKESDLIQQLNESKYIINYIDCIEKLEKQFIHYFYQIEQNCKIFQRIFLLGNNEDEEIQNYIKFETHPTFMSISPQKQNQNEENQLSPNKNGEKNDESLSNQKDTFQNNQNEFDQTHGQSFNESSRKNTLKSNNNELVNFIQFLLFFLPIIYQDQNRNILVERLNQFYEKHEQGPFDIIEKLKFKLESLKVLSQSLHKRYQELINLQQERQIQLKHIDEEIQNCQSQENLIITQKNCKDKTEDVAPPEDYENYQEWMRCNLLPNVQTHSKKHNNTIKEIHSGSNIGEDEDEQDSYCEDEGQNSLGNIQSSQFSITNQERKYSSQIESHQKQDTHTHVQRQTEDSQSQAINVQDNIENEQNDKENNQNQEETSKQTEKNLSNNENHQQNIIENNQEESNNDEIKDQNDQDDQDDQEIQEKDEEMENQDEDNSNEQGEKQPNNNINETEDDQEEELQEKNVNQEQENDEKRDSYQNNNNSGQSNQEINNDQKEKNKFQQARNLQLNEDAIKDIKVQENMQENDREQNADNSNESPTIQNRPYKPRMSRENIKVVKEKQILQQKSLKQFTQAELIKEEQNINQVLKQLEEQQKQTLQKNNTINQMQIYISEVSKLSKTQIKNKIDQFEKFGFQVFLNFVETLFRYILQIIFPLSIFKKLIKRLTQMVQDVSRKAKSVMSDKQIEHFGDILQKFVSNFRKGVAVKRNTNLNRINFIESNPEPKVFQNLQKVFILIYFFKQVIRKEDAKKFSFMEPLVKRFEREKNKQSILVKENPTEEQLSPTTPTGKKKNLILSYLFIFQKIASGPGYLPTSVSQQDRKKNRVEKFLDNFSYAPLDYIEIESTFLQFFPSQNLNCKIFIEAIKNDMYLSFFESLDSIFEYLSNICDEYEDEEEASIQAIKKIYILKEQSQKHHWKNIKEIFEQYLKFYTTMHDQIDNLLSNASVNLKRAFKNKHIKQDNKLQKKYQEFVIDKLEQYKNEVYPLSEPITENKMVNLKDLEESAKEKANTDDLKKIIFKLANSDTSKKHKYGSIQESPQKKKNNSDNQNGNINQQNSIDDDEINLLDQNTKKQLKYQNMNEEEYLDFESKQVKNEAEGRDENQLTSMRNQTITKLHDQRDFYQHKETTSYHYLKSFVESDKVIWKLRKRNILMIIIKMFQLAYKLLIKVENTKDFKDKFTGLHMEDYIPKNNKQIPRDQFYLSKRSNNSQQKQIDQEKQASVDWKKNSHSQFKSQSQASIDSRLILQQFKPQFDKTKSTLLTPLSKNFTSDYYHSTSNSVSQSTSMLTSREKANKGQFNSAFKQSRDGQQSTLFPVINQITINNPNSSTNLKYQTTSDIYKPQSPLKNKITSRNYLDKDNINSKTNNSLSQHKLQVYDRYNEDYVPKVKKQKNTKLMEDLINQERLYLQKK